MALPVKQTELRRLRTVDELAQDRFGDVEGLAIVHKTTLELAGHYAARFGLDSTDPEVTVIASALSFARHKEFTLLLELERDLFTEWRDRVKARPMGRPFSTLSKLALIKKFIGNLIGYTFVQVNI